MSNKLEEARKIINEVDAQMAELFVKRMRAAELVCEHKMAFGLPILDQKREDAVVERNSALVDDEVLKSPYDTRFPSGKILPAAIWANAPSTPLYATFNPLWIRYW